MDGSSQHLPDSPQTDKPRLLLLSHEYPCRTGDASFLTEEVRALAQRFQITLVPLAASGADAASWGPLPEGVQLIRGFQAPTWSQILPRFLQAYRAPEVLEEIQDARQRAGSASADPDCIPREARYRWASAQCMATQLSKLLEAAGCRDFDLLYSFWMHTEALALLNLATAQEKRTGHRPLVISRTHGYDLYEERYPFGRQLFKILEARSLDGVYFACGTARDYFDAHWGLDGLDSGVFFLGTSSEEETIQPQPGQGLTLVSCSNSIPLKRIEAIIRALALLDEQTQDPSRDLPLDWHHIGDGESQASLQRLAQEQLGSRTRITWTFHGHVPNEDLKDLYRSLEPDLFITASSTEGGVPVSIQEAFSLGIPAIGTNMGGIPEIVLDGQTGFLLDGGIDDPAQLAQALADAIRRFAALDLQERQRLSRNALDLQRQRFDSRTNADAFAKHLLELVDARAEDGRF